MFDISRAQVKNISELEILSIYKFLLVRLFISHLFLPYVHCACAHTHGYINVCMFDLASCYLGDNIFFTPTLFSLWFKTQKPVTLVNKFDFVLAGREKRKTKN